MNADDPNSKEALKLPSEIDTAPTSGNQISWTSPFCANESPKAASVTVADLSVC